jgi:sulfite oxidase
MRTEIKEVQGIDWFDGAVMNCLWRGPRLRDVLLDAGIGDDMHNEKGYQGHVAFACFEKPCQDEPWYGGSIPLDRAMKVDGDCILALEVSTSFETSVLCAGILSGKEQLKTPASFVNLSIALSIS